QATFLVLARRAGMIRQPELLANWLYGVAYRTAVRARGRAAQRRRRERRAAVMPVWGPPPAAEAEEALAALHEELKQLDGPERRVVVLCYLEGKTQEEAARELGWPLGSMSWRLAQAREALRQRLSRRGHDGPTGEVLLARNSSAGAGPRRSKRSRCL